MATSSRDEASGDNPVADGEVPGPLRISRLAFALGLTRNDLARAAGISGISMGTIMTAGKWPRFQSRVLLQQRIDDALRLAGAAEVDLVDLYARLARRPNTGAKPDSAARQLSTRRPRKVTKMLLPKQSLRPEARKAFKLAAGNPFDGEVQTEASMFVSADVAYVREACMQAAVGHRFVAVVGESGGGKTTVLANLEARIARERKSVTFIRPWVLGMEESSARGKPLKSADILASVIRAFEPRTSTPATMQARSALAYELLSQNAKAGASNLLVIEEAHSLPDSTLKHLKRLHEMRVGMQSLLGILLIGQTELAERLDPRRLALREVTQRCEVIQLLPLDGDLPAYLQHRAKCFDRSIDEFIDAEGIEEIRARLTTHRKKGGDQTEVVSLAYPLAVNNLITAALNLAAQTGIPIVTKEVIRAL